MVKRIFWLYVVPAAIGAVGGSVTASLHSGAPFGRALTMAVATAAVCAVGAATVGLLVETKRRKDIWGS